MVNPGSVLDRWLRSLGGQVLAVRDGVGGWGRYRQEFLQTCTKSPASLTQSVGMKLNRIVRHAGEGSPYYRTAWKGLQLPPVGKFATEDLELLPLINKETLRARSRELVSDGLSSSELIESYTGGTTGIQTKIYMDPKCRINRIGRQWGVLQRCGYRPGMRRALIWGVESDLLPKNIGASLKLAFRHYAASDEVLCCTVMNDDLMREYYARLRRFRPEVIYGYPTAVARFAAFILREGLASIAVSSIIVTAERLIDDDRALIREVFGGDVFNIYCTREHGCMAFECGAHRGLHVDAESIHVEIVRDGKVLPRGQSGEIVVTDLCNYGMPLIRYRTGDLGALSPEPCPCGLGLPLLSSLDGRSTDSLVRPDGSVVVGLMLSDLFMGEPSIRAAQFVQERLESVDVLLETTNGFSQDVASRCRAEVQTLMGPDVIVSIRPVAAINRNPTSGKIQEVICRIGR